MIIAGPAYLVKTYGKDAQNQPLKATFFSESDITVTLEKETKERKASHLGKFDEALLAVKAEIKFKPVEWNNINVLFPWSNYRLGQALFGDEELPTEIYSSDGKKYTFAKTALTASPSIGAGVEKDLMGEATITALISKTKTFADDDAIYSVTNATFNPDDLDEDKIFSIPFTVLFGSTQIEAEEGVDIELSVNTAERKKDACGIYDYIFTGLEVSAKFKPTDILINRKKIMDDRTKATLIGSADIALSNGKKIAVKLLPLRKFTELSDSLSDEVKLIALFTDKTEEEIDALPIEDCEKILAKGKELNYPAFFRWGKRQSETAKFLAEIMSESKTLGNNGATQ